jgi:DNA-binding transcriptional LysR family regulator
MGDEIFVRSGRTMLPTPYALAIRDEVHAIVLRAQSVLAQRDALNLAQLERAFTIQCHDVIASALGATLLARMRKDAPNVVLRLLAEPATDTSDLRQGVVDLDIGSATPTHRDLAHSVWGSERLVVAMRSRHPLARRKLTLRAYAGAEHVTVSRRGRLRDPVDDALEAQGLARRVVASAPTTTIALQFVIQRDLLVVMPSTLCGRAMRALPLKTKPLPLNVPPLRVVSSWHRRHDADPAHRWFRELVRSVITSELEPNSKAL